MSGLSKKTNLHGDIAKKGAPKLSSAPFTRAIGKNTHGSAKSEAAGHIPGGGVKRKNFTDGSTSKGWK